jgi:Na+/H+ antiporter NhaD/arsenite permease-like protein
LQQYHAREVLARAVTPEQIQVCFLLGNSAFNRCLVAISVAAVFFGATTYIGNGPNFMVKSIVDHEGIRTPTFAGYFFRYAMPFLGPLLLAVGWLFFR